MKKYPTDKPKKSVMFSIFPTLDWNMNYGINCNEFIQSLGQEPNDPRALYVTFIMMHIYHTVALRYLDICGML